jgi:hypothetical protein
MQVIVKSISLLTPADAVKLLKSLILLMQSRYAICKLSTEMAGTCYAAHLGWHESAILFVYWHVWLDLSLATQSVRFFLLLYCHFSIEPHIRFLFRLGRGSVLVCLLPWLQALLSRHMSSIVSQESSLMLLNSLYQVSIYFQYQLQWCTDIK